jgi:signal transduction histidine kinase
MDLGLAGPVTEAQHEQLRRIQESQQHLLGIINDLLNFSRLESGHVKYDIAAVPLADVLERVRVMIEPQALSKQLDLEIGDCPTALLATGDRMKIEQIVLNLLSNAVKFTPPGGRILLLCGATGDRAWLRVRDTGIGIPRAEQESIFAPFVQVGRSLSNPQHGTGLGLAISRDLARAMNGDLTVESLEGAGSTFTLTLPNAKPDVRRSGKS